MAGNNEVKSTKVLIEEGGKKGEKLAKGLVEGQCKSMGIQLKTSRRLRESEKKCLEAMEERIQKEEEKKGAEKEVNVR